MPESNSMSIWITTKDLTCKCIVEVVSEHQARGPCWQSFCSSTLFQATKKPQSFPRMVVATLRIRFRHHQIPSSTAFLSSILSSICHRNSRSPLRSSISARKSSQSMLQNSMLMREFFCLHLAIDAWYWELARSVRSNVVRYSESPDASRQACLGSVGGRANGSSHYH
ncbi:hypothetical protein CONLIGDRAFT_388641 [Coniochaeta ligniaria NRRL 30616]|uniref:Uncharacterized protein n=1 Tax=Coniochaeta ligniaria NRRL 30616 TaxID=1408157 RepID=A0A1J7IMC2_9PEZI|nr:hypothetical protein CONLIGDRAFT_388641 [Coniochaeta ligniaria NRRL 30616]